ncbi:hypothetical protein SDJN02_07161, partial [Cucurbita argyrosperma subsp. argyrosperma]
MFLQILFQDNICLKMELDSLTKLDMSFSFGFFGMHEAVEALECQTELWVKFGDDRGMVALLEIFNKLHFLNSKPTSFEIGQ